MREHTTLSVVVPVYNEEKVLPLLVDRLRPVLDKTGEAYEVVAVDDGSTDATPAVLAGLRLSWPELRVIRLGRNSGHQAALRAGLFQSRGAYVVSIDADLQDPPETIPEMLQLARTEGLDIVYGVRADRSTDTVFKRWTAAGYYHLIRRLVGRRVPHDAGDFRLLSRTTIDALRGMPGHAQVLRLVIPWLGLPNGEVRYARAERAAGRTKYPLGKMLALALDSVTSFSAAPLRIATVFGGIGVAVCALLVIAALVAHLAGNTVSGWTSLYIAVLFLGAVQLLCLGLLGEYVARIYTAVQGRPAYLIVYDSDDDAAPTAGSGAATDGSGAVTAGGEAVTAAPAQVAGFDESLTDAVARRGGRRP
jgi:polyisoprenyl-phosphate glycosyltransferase